MDATTVLGSGIGSFRRGSVVRDNEHMHGLRKYYSICSTIEHRTNRRLSSKKQQNATNGAHSHRFATTTLGFV